MNWKRAVEVWAGAVLGMSLVGAMLISAHYFGALPTMAVIVVLAVFAFGLLAGMNA